MIQKRKTKFYSSMHACTITIRVCVLNESRGIWGGHGHSVPRGSADGHCPRKWTAAADYVYRLAGSILYTARQYGLPSCAHKRQYLLWENSKSTVPNLTHSTTRALSTKKKKKTTRALQLHCAHYCFCIRLKLSCHHLNSYILYIYIYIDDHVVSLRLIYILYGYLCLC